MHDLAARVASRPAGRPPAARAAAIAVGGLVGLVVVTLVLGWAITGLDDAPGWVERTDQRVVDGLAERRTPAMDSVAAAASELTDPPTVIGAGAGAGVVLVAIRRWRELAVLVVGLVVELAGYVVVAAVVDRPRPSVAIGVEPTAGFPSGHVAAAVVLYGGLSVVVARLAPPTDDPRPFRALVALAVVAVSAARLYEGMHFPSDVVVGWAYGLGCLFVGLAAADALAAAAPGTDDATRVGADRA